MSFSSLALPVSSKSQRSSSVDTSFAIGATAQFSARAVLPARANGLWKIETGLVQTLSWLEDGTLTVLGIWGPGDMVGNALSTLDPYQMECVTAVEARFLPPQAWQQEVDTLVSVIQQMQEFQLIRSCRRVETMLLSLLTWLAKKFGREVETGHLIDLRLTHQDLADMLGTTRVTITRLLSQLEHQGMIRRLPLHRIVLKDSEIWHYEI
jgi:CRP-like cAMP-binding protein